MVTLKSVEQAYEAWLVADPNGYGGEQMPSNREDA